MDSAVKMELLRALVSECLSVAAEEILRLVQKTLLQDGEACTKWVVDNQHRLLDAEHREPQPLRPQPKDGVDLRVCWKLPTDHNTATPRDDHSKLIHSENMSRPEEQPHENKKTDSAQTDCGSDRCPGKNELSSPEAQACESPQPLCLYRVQPVTHKQSSLTPASKNPKAAHGAGSSTCQSWNHSQNLPKFIIQFKAGTAQKPYKCPCCSRAFSLTKTLIRHMKVHAEDQSYQCRVCGKRFCQRSHLVSHMRVHTGEKPYHCQLCPKTFSQKGSVAVHMRRHHSDTHFPCPQCPSSFTCQSDLALHVQSHHSPTKSK